MSNSQSEDTASSSTERDKESALKDAEKNVAGGQEDFEGSDVQRQEQQQSARSPVHQPDDEEETQELRGDENVNRGAALSEEVEGEEEIEETEEKEEDEEEEEKEEEEKEEEEKEEGEKEEEEKEEDSTSESAAASSDRVADDDNVAGAKDSASRTSDDEFDVSRLETPHQLRVYRRAPGYRYKMPALQKFRKTAHSIILWLRLYHYHSSQVREILRYFSDADLLPGAMEESNFDELLFSVQSYRPNKQARLNHKTLSIMRRLPSERTQRETRPIEAGLRGYDAFNKYPPNILRKIAEKAWFQEFERHSVIVREGDHPLYYYFIIYGSALVSIIDRQKMVARTAALLNRGDSFGELAIIEQAKRASTVIAREKCGLMLLEGRDYLEIFMHGGVKFLDNSFVRNHVLFRGFDIGVLKGKSKQVKLNYFPPGATIVENSTMSAWIFLVISGKATVKMAVRKSVLQQQEEDVRDRDELERERLLAEYRQGGLGHKTLIRRNWRSHLLRQDRLSRRADFAGNLEQRQLGLPRLGGFTRELSEVGREQTRIAGSEKGFTLPQLTKAYLVAPAPGEQPQAQEQRTNQRETPPKSGQADDNAAPRPSQKITYVTGQEAVIGRRTLATDLNREFFEQFERKLMLGEFEEESLFEYLPVQILEKGMLFGLAHHFFENQPTMKLISKGCELLCVHRELYLDNSSELVLFEVGKTLRPYPSELAVLAKNKEVHTWSDVKSRHYGKTLTDMARASVNVHDARTRFPAIRTTR